MAPPSSLRNLRGKVTTEVVLEKPKNINQEIINNMAKNTEKKKADKVVEEESFEDDFGFLGNYDDENDNSDSLSLPENTAKSAISCAFIGVGGGGGKMAKAFIDIGFNKTFLINTTEKDQPSDLDEKHFLLIPGADGVGKDVSLGKEVFDSNSAMVEDALRTRVGKIDWLFVLCGGGGGTGSAAYALNKSFERFLSTREATGRVIYVVSKPTAQEMLNPTIVKNYESLLEDVSKSTHIVIDNEKQLELLRGKVGLLNMYPAANSTFAKLFWQFLKMASESSPVQTFDTKDLEKCLGTDGRIFIGSTIIKNTDSKNLGADIYQGSINGSPCLKPGKTPTSGALLLLVTEDHANDPNVSNQLEAAVSYVGGRADILFSGIYIKNKLPGLIGLVMLGGVDG
jgi:cell division GTPase FtsZ